jgi:hypothetical protein
MNTIKKILHVPYFGPMIGFYMGVKGYNRAKRTVTRANGSLSLSDRFWNMIPSFNSRVNKGADLIGSLITGTSLNSISSPLPPKYIALNITGVITAAKTDTALANEATTNGMGRTLGTQGGYTGPSVLDGAASYTVTNTFTCATGGVTVYAAALLDAASTGNLFVEANLSSSAVLNVGDTLALTWTVNY